MKKKLKTIFVFVKSDDGILEVSAVQLFISINFMDF